MNCIDAVRRMVAGYPGGREAVALRLGKSPEVLKKELQHGTPHCKLGLLDAVHIAQMCHEVGSADADALAVAVAAESGGTFTAGVLNLHQNMGLSRLELVSHCLRSVAPLSSEGADLVSAVVEAAADGHVSDNELRRIEREALDALQAVQRILEAARAANAASKPTPQTW